MNDFFDTGQLIIVFSCILLHYLFSILLERIIPDEAPVYKEIFTLTNPALIQGVATPSLRLKYILPWTSSPDLSVIGSLATKFLFLSRLFAILGILTLIFTVIFGVIPVNI